MATVLLTWNPGRWDFAEFEDVVKRTAAGELVDDRWSVSHRRHGIDRGDLAFLMRQGNAGRGLVGFGVVQGPPYEDEHWAMDGRASQYVDLLWSELLPLDRMIAVDELEVEVPEVGWNTIYRSGRTIPEPLAERLGALWARHSTRGLPFSPLEMLESAELVEGNKVWALASRYERNPIARRHCLDHYGFACTVCGFDFESVYGALGRGYAHVHHVVPLHAVGDEHVVDPVRDLRPVCANCHYMLHRSGDPILTPDELRQRLRQGS